MEPTCVNLAERFGDKYKISYDPAFDPHGKHRDKIDPFDMQIPCRKGTVYPLGGSRLAFEINGRRSLVKELRGLPFLKITQDGDREATFAFDVADFDKVAELVKPHRRPIMSEAQREAARARLLALRSVPA